MQKVEVQESEWRLTEAKGPTMGKESGWDSGRAAVAAVVGGVVAVGTVPVALSAMGFTSVGIAASSIAAKMMSTAAIANGGELLLAVWWLFCSQWGQLDSL
ncbi:IFI27L1 isoform 8 [Pan troglodytes]|uniref:IFI27L1 isoform 8 n=1 Tax=Pan troglodytes TaxID=9598 RepID=A0A2J8QMN6_PANTR|nr:IFI27L1 isoform 8 [Pan troglodytes]